MQMKSVSKVQFGKLNDKRFYFAIGIISLPLSYLVLIILIILFRRIKKRKT